MLLHAGEVPAKLSQKAASAAVLTPKAVRWWKCPTDGSTALFGVVHQSTFPGRTTPDAAFELLAVELAPKGSPMP